MEYEKVIHMLEREANGNVEIKERIYKNLFGVVGVSGTNTYISFELLDIFHFNMRKLAEWIEGGIKAVALAGNSIYHHSVKTSQWEPYKIRNIKYEM